MAYCGLADNYAYMGSVVMPEKEAMAKEKEFAQKALELDPELAEAHMSLAACTRRRLRLAEWSERIRSRARTESKSGIRL